MKNESLRKVINVDKSNYHTIWTFKQEDDAVLKLSLIKGSTSLDITGQSIKLGVLRADKTLVELEDQSCFKINKNELDITLKNNILSVPGKAECDLTLIDTSGKMTTTSFFIEVKKKTTGMANIVGTNIIEGLEKLKNDFKSTGDKLISAFSKEYESLKRIIIDENQAANLQDQVNQTNAQLDNKANKNELMSLDNSKMDKDTTNISITQINKNLGKIDQTFLTDELINQISGSTPINATISPRSVTTDKLAHKSVTTCETSFFEDIINIFNYKTATDGYYVDRTNGNLVEGANNFVSDFILIENNTQYKSKHWGSIASYDENKKYISGADINPSTPYTTPSNSCYVRYSVTGINNKTVAMLCKSIYDNSKFIPFGKTNIKNEYIDIDYIKNQLMISDNIPLILPDNTSFFGNHLNLFDVSKATIGTAINGANGELLVGSGYENNYISDFIKINQNNVYYASQYSIFHFYDKNKKWIGKGNNDGNGKPNKPLDNSVYMRINGVNKEYINSNYVCENEYTNSLHPYGTIFLKDEHIDKGGLSGWKGKKWCSFGHSIVQQEKWQNEVAKYFDFKHINCGIGGSTVCGTDGSTGSNPMWTDERINAIPTDCDLITILAGVNDQRDTDNMGAWGSKDTETFYGAYTVMLEKIYKRCPNAKIILMRDTRRKIENWGIWKADDYRDAVSKIGKEFGYPVIDMDKLCGINYLNWDTYLMDDTHPNDLGGMKMSEVVIGFLKSIYPLQ